MGRLILTLKPGQRIHIGEDVVVTLVRVDPNGFVVRLGFEADRSIGIDREEVYQRKLARRDQR